MSSRTLEPVAVVGIGCRFPGAGNADEYWEMIKRAGTAISPLPQSRLDRDLYYHPEKGRIGSTYTVLSGVVPETPFDHNRFPIPDELVSSYDSVHLRMLEVCCEAVTSAGMDPLSGLGGSRTGVYIGNTSGSTMAGDLVFGTLSTEVLSRLRDSEFADLPSDLRERAIQRTIAQIQANTPVRNIGGGPNVEAHDVSELVSRAMQLDGPVVAVDAACASALIATAQAVYALQRGHLDMAIAGGCSFSKWFALVLFSQAQSVSGTGTRPFDQDADGLISSDGYAAIVLKPLSKAQADGDSILSVIRNLAIGSDGKGKSLWAPRREGQINAVRRAYNAEVSPSTLQYIECHATSTQVGDATEVSALSEAMNGAFPPGHKIPIGSAKGNIGHTLECAGMAGVCKTIQALRHGVIPPQPSINQLNPEIAWNDIPFYVPTSAQPWPELNQHGVRRAAVNAFGIGGLNAHFVLDDRPEPRRTTRATVPADVQPAAVSTDDNLVAVIGVGVIAPDANNQDEFWSLISSGKSAISEVTDDRWIAEHYHASEPAPRFSSSKLGGFVRNFEFNWKKHRIPPKQVQNSNPLQYMLLDAADQAFIDAGLGDMEFPRERASVVVGTTFGGDFSAHIQVGLRLPEAERELKKALMADGIDEPQADSIVTRYREHALNIYPAIRDETGSFTSSTLASRLTKSFDLMGGAWAIDAADVSSFACLQAAADLLLTGSSDMVMCAAGQRSMDISSYEIIDLKGNLSSDRVSPAFDANQNGGVPGEAVGIILLKRLADAERDGDRIRGVIRGIEISFADQNRTDGIAKNLKRLMPADGQAARIDAVETARVCSSALDAAEIEGMQRALPAQPAPLALGSTSKQIGYCLSASGMISVIKAMLELEHQSIAPVAADAEPSELVRNSGRQFTLPKQMAPLGNQLPPGAGRILVSNIDPSGAIGHLILEGAKERMNTSVPDPAATAPPIPQSSSAELKSFEILRVAAESTSELEAAVAAGVTNGIPSFGPADRVRLGIVATGADDLARKLPATRVALADYQRRHILGDNGILITEPGQLKKNLAVVFSGQGAQYSGMLTDWIETSVAVRTFIEETNAVLASLNLPSFEFLTQNEAADLGNHVLNTQLAVLLADLAAWAALKEAGVEPDFIAGHSYGEFPALVAAGAWDLHAALQATIHRTNAVEGAGVSNAAMVSTTAEPTTVTALIQKLQIPCDIACYNAPDQTIIAGRISDLDQLSEELKTGGYASRTIRVPMPYHSRMMQAAQAPMAAALQQIPIVTPEVQFISCGSNRALETPEEIRANLVAELTHPVRWETLVETLIAKDTGVVIESGPRQILTRLNRRIIGARPVLHLALDARPGHAKEQQARIKLLLEMVRETASASVPVGSISTSATEPESVASRQRVVLTPSENVSMTDDQNKGRITWVDATERRRSKMREAAQAKVAGQPVPYRESDNGAVAKNSGARVSSNGNGVHPATRPSETGDADSQTGIGGVPTPVAVAPAVEPRTTASTAPAPKAETSTLSQPVTVGAAQICPANELSRDKLESFVLDYVVEQTGYPPELVELDANLEADLGVDSIRKAQLMGEISETFEIEQAKNHINDLSLDDFADLGSIIDFFLTICESPDAAQSATPVAPKAPPAPLASVAAPVSSPDVIDSSASSAEAVQPTPAASTTVSVSKEELMTFATAFVVEQTGYPEELVEPNADLEGDLGIDSIRKAQLLGEIAENYQMTNLATQITDLSLDDFPTLETITNFFCEAAGCTTEHGTARNNNAAVPTDKAESASKPANTVTLPAFDRVPVSERVMQRYVVRSRPESLPDSVDATGISFAGKVVILGNHPDSVAIAERLQSAASVVDIIAVSTDAAAAVSQLEASWSRQPVQHLIVMTSNGEQPADWDTLRNQQLLVPYFVIQRWIQLRAEAYGKETPPVGHLAAVTRLGGDFGIGGRIGNVSGAGLTGLFKGIIREYEELNAIVLDAPTDEPIRLVADALCREASAAQSAVEVGVIRGKRYCLQMVPQPASGLNQSDGNMSGPWVVTGGARGITARIAAALGRTPGVRLHLVGRSPEPEIDPAWIALDDTGLKELKKDVMRKAAVDGQKPIDAWNSLNRNIDLAKSLQDLRNQGLDFTYHACDVSNRAAVGQMLQAVRRQHGSITGVIHGAGIEAAARFDRKKADSVQLTVTSKVDGARWLWDHTTDDNLSYFVGFGSTSGRFGGLGQTDYSMASDLLCRMGWEFQTERPGCRVFGIHWPAWGEIGMAARPESRFALESAGLKFVDPDEGISHLLDEFDINASDGEVAIVDRNMSVDAEGQERDAQFIHLAHQLSHEVQSRPFADSIIGLDANSLSTELSIDPVKHPQVADHVAGDIPVVPGVVLLEVCLQAAEWLSHGQVIAEARNFQILNGIRCRDGQSQKVHARATRLPDGSIDCLLTTEFKDQKNRIVDPARPVVSVRVIMADEHPSGPAQQDLPSDWEVLKQATHPDDFDPRHSGTVFHGPSMGRLKGAIITDRTQGWFRNADPQGKNTPPGGDRPAILDATMQGSDILLQRYAETDQLLRGVDRIIFHQPLEGQHELVSHSLLTDEVDGSAVWTERCFTLDGQAVITTEGHRSYQLKNRLAQANVSSATREDSSKSVVVDEESVTTPTVVHEKIIRPLMLRSGIKIEGNAVTVTVPVDPVADRFLSEHTLRNVPLLPAVMAAEIMGEAAEVLAQPGERTIVIRNMQIHNGIKCAGTDVRNLVVRCQRNGNDVAVRLFESAEADSASITASILLGSQTPPMETTISKPHGELMDYPYSKDAPIQHGPCYQTLKKLAPWRFQGTAHLQIGESCLADDFPPEAEWIIDPAILDGVLVGCGSDAWLYYGYSPEIPDSFDEIIVGKMLNPRETCIAGFKCRTTFKEDRTVYDLVLQDSANQTFMQVNGLTMKRLMPVKTGWLTMAGY
ncbi:MAG: acyltransferase domain-containing protein [Fuerstiella sp.]|nr:acyltransferase domain-containing protein [Fuerstiella sp.]